MGTHRTARRRPSAAAVAVAALACALGLTLLPVVVPSPDARETPDASRAGADDPRPVPSPAGPPEPATPDSPGGPGGPGGPDGPGPSGPANVVLVVLDDFSTELLRTMPHLVALQERAATYTNAFVVNSLCCPSRAATFTGLPPHLNGVLANTSGGPLGALGGYPAFEANGNAERSYNVSLQAAGYRTGFVGKYLNEYEPVPLGGGLRAAPPLIDGWDDFEALSGGAYQGWGFYATRRVDDALELREYERPDRPERPLRPGPRRELDETYADAVIADEALTLLRRYQRRDARREQPWLLHVAPYGTHARTQATYPGEPFFPPALRDRPSAEPARGQLRAGGLQRAVGDRPPRVRRPARRQRAVPARRGRGGDPGSLRGAPSRSC